ncbi:hypothetical protein [Helicobacter fennelliae]|nr:hypothetical protein [Helicobacter fennelliae]
MDCHSSKELCNDNISFIRAVFYDWYLLVFISILWLVESRF